MLENAFKVEPVAGALGALISGIDLAELDDATFADVKQAFLDHNVIFFRGQRLSPSQQVSLARRFGDIHFHPYVAGLPEQPEILEIVKRETDKRNFGGTWHSDQAFSPRPAMATILYAKETPSAGGDTLFASGTLAYETLSEGMKRMIQDLRVFNVGDRTGKRTEVLRAQTAMRARDPIDEITEATHPLVRTHPETGRKALYLSSHTVRFADMTEEESAPLLAYLRQHATRPELTCRFRWEPGSLAIWDNRCTQHHALNDYHGHRRVMHRITIKGDTPV